MMKIQGGIRTFSRIATSLPAPYPNLHSSPGALFKTVAIWIERSRQRSALANLDERLLKDIGITRTDAAHEVATPFWRSN